MARFVVLRHETPAESSRADHFDLMLEQDACLATWEIHQWPPAGTQKATRLADHRLEYLQFEGEIASGVGHVHRVCTGTFDLTKLNENDWVVNMSGRTFRGVVHLTRSQKSDDPQRWTLSFEPVTFSGAEAGFPDDR